MTEVDKMEKLQEYQGVVGRLHTIRDNVKEKYQTWKEQNISITKNSTCSIEERYSHIFRTKTVKELVRISAAVMGIEFSYAAETAFVSPTLLTIGVDHTRMTMIWALSPLIGLFLTPLLGSLSDKCSLPFGRRRIFILLLSFGILLGLILVPNGKELGIKFGDYYPPKHSASNSSITAVEVPKSAETSWGVFFTVLGTVLLDFDADACQSPARAYLLDVTQPEDHARGLTTFTIMAGIGGFLGYGLGGINWDDTFLGSLMGGHVKAVFSLITVIFVACVFLTITSFAEIPLTLLESANLKGPPPNEPGASKNAESYGTMKPPDTQETQFAESVNDVDATKVNEPERNLGAPTLKDYLLSIVFMPRSILILCITNLFCWMAHVSYSLNFTDYVGESVFGGDPKAPEGSLGNILYEQGVRFGCWGMSMYSLSCCGYSLIIEKLIKGYGAKTTYVGGLAFYGVGMILMAITNSKISVIIFSCTAGVLYSTLFTMPYLLIAHYHSKEMFDEEGTVHPNRGLGTDVAIVSSMVFFAQFTFSLIVGYLVSVAETTAVIVYASGVLGLLASASATQILYLDL